MTTILYRLQFVRHTGTCDLIYQCNNSLYDDLGSSFDSGVSDSTLVSSVFVLASLASLSSCWASE